MKKDKKATMAELNEKIAGVLTPEHQAIFESAVETLVEEKVAERLVESEEALKVKYAEMSEGYVTEQVATKTEELKVTLAEEYSSKLVKLEERLRLSLNTFLERVVAENISDSIIEKMAINEVAHPLVTKIQGLFKESCIAIDPNHQKKIDEAEAKVAKYETMLTEALAGKIDSENRIEKLAVFLTISEKTQGFLPSQKKLVVEEFKNSSFEDVDAKIDTFVKLIKESEENKFVGLKKTTPEGFKPSKKTIVEMVTTDDAVPAKKTIVEKEEVVAVPKNPLLDMAGSYLLNSDT